MATDKHSKTYYAVCNSSDFKSYYVKSFTMPTPLTMKDIPEYLLIDNSVNDDTVVKISPSWWFCNVVDSFACVHAVYEKEIFDNATSVLRG